MDKLQTVVAMFKQTARYIENCGHFCASKDIPLHASLWYDSARTLTNNTHTHTSHTRLTVAVINLRLYRMRAPSLPTLAA